ncbi:MAG: hypothetical protein LBU62_09320 [Bacteroidales bacterium]|jgi:hypothetical protein|nr:hypothetical protein [Bacteroidales bacterium]
MKADASVVVYIIVAVLALLGSGIEKWLKAKRAQQQHPAIPDHDAEEEDMPEQQPSLKDIIRQLTQEAEAMSEPEPQYEPEFELEPAKVEYQPLEIIPTEPEYLVSHTFDLPDFVHVDTSEKEKIPETHIFNIRQAVIASEILNRKY